MANPPYPLHALRGDRWGSWGFPRVDGYEPVPTTLDFCVMPVQSGRKQVLLRLQRGTGEPALGRARAKRTCCRAAAGTACSCHLGGRRSACSLMWAWSSGSARRRPAPHAARRKVTHEVNTSRRPTGEGAKPPPVHWGTTHPALKTRRGKTHGPRGALVRGVGPKMPNPEWTRAQRPQLKPQRHTG